MSLQGGSYRGTHAGQLGCMLPQLPQATGSSDLDQHLQEGQEGQEGQRAGGNM